MSAPASFGGKGSGAHGTIWRGASVRALATAVSRAAAFVASIVIVRNLNLKTAGAFFFAISIASLAGRAMSLGFPEGLARLVPALGADDGPNRGRARRLLNTALRTCLLVGLVATGLVALILPWFLGSRAVAMTAALALAGVFAIQASAASFLRARGRVFSAEGWLGAVAPVFLAGLVILIAVSNNADAGEVFGLRFAIESLSAAFLVIAAFRQVPGPAGREPIRQVVGVTIPLWLTSLSWLAIAQADVVILGAVRGTAAVGGYVPILRTAALAAVAFGFFGVYLLPAAARLKAESAGGDIQEIYTAVSKATYVFAAPVIAGLLVAPDALIGGLFGIHGESVAIIARLLAAAYWVNAILGFNGVTLEAIGRVDTLAKRSIAALTLTLIADLAFIPLFGAPGAALGTLIGLVTLNLLNSGLLYRAASITPFRPDMLITIASSCAAGVAIALAGAAGAGLGPLLIMLIGVFVVCAAAAYVTTSKTVRASIWTSFSGGSARPAAS